MLLGGGAIGRRSALQPAFQVVLRLVAGLPQQLDAGAQLPGFLFHAVHGAQQVANAANRVAQVACFQHFARDELVDGIHRLVGHETGESARGVGTLALGYRVALAAQRPEQPRQVGALAFVGLHRLLAELLAQQVGQFGDRHGVATIRVFTHEVGQSEHLPGHDHHQQLVLPRLRLDAGAIQVGAHADDCGKRLRRFAPGGMEDAGDIAVAIVWPGEGAVVATQHVGGEGAHLLAAAAALGGFILPRVVGEQVVVGRGHQRLQGIGGGGLARAVAAGKQVYRAEFQFFRGQVAPVHGNGVFQVHGVRGVLWLAAGTRRLLLTGSPPLVTARRCRPARQRPPAPQVRCR